MRLLRSVLAPLLLSAAVIAIVACNGDGDNDTPVDGDSGPNPTASSPAGDDATPDGDSTPDASSTDVQGASATPADSSLRPPPGGADVPADAEGAVAAARELLAEMFEGRGDDDISVISVTATEWPDSCLGRPETGEACAQVITPGYRIVLRLEPTGVFTYHSDEGANVRLADFDLTPA